MSEWATYLLKRVPESVKTDIRAEATQRSTSPANVVRAILCDHFGLDCPQARAYMQPPFKPEADTIFIRMQPALFAEIKQAASRNAEPMRDVILSALKAHYNHNGGTPE